MNMPFVPIECRNLTCKETAAIRGVIRLWIDIIPEK